MTTATKRPAAKRKAAESDREISALRAEFLRLQATMESLEARYRPLAGCLRGYRLRERVQLSSRLVCRVRI
jgi:hypothetical protein